MCVCVCVVTPCVTVHNGIALDRALRNVAKNSRWYGLISCHACVTVVWPKRARDNLKSAVWKTHFSTCSLVILRVRQTLIIWKKMEKHRAIPEDKPNTLIALLSHELSTVLASVVELKRWHCSSGETFTHGQSWSRLRSRRLLLLSLCIVVAAAASTLICNPDSRPYTRDPTHRLVEARTLHVSLICWHDYDFVAKPGGRELKMPM